MLLILNKHESDLHGNVNFVISFKKFRILYIQLTRGRVYQFDFFRCHVHACVYIFMCVCVYVCLCMRSAFPSIPGVALPLPGKDIAFCLALLLMWFTPVYPNG